MAIPFILTEIENHLNTLKSKEEKINHLVELLFGRQKRRAEMEGDKPKLSFLKKQTKNDYEIYQNEFLNGRLVYLSREAKWNKITAKRLGIKNIDLLMERLSLENKLNLINGEILVLKGLIAKTKNLSDNKPVLKETENTNNPQMQLETKNTEALVYEINNFHLEWRGIKKKFELFYNDNPIMQENYPLKLENLLTNCLQEINNNLLIVSSVEKELSYLNRLENKLISPYKKKDGTFYTYLEMQFDLISDKRNNKNHTGNNNKQRISNFITIDGVKESDEEYKVLYPDKNNPESLGLLKYFLMMKSNTQSKLRTEIEKLKRTSDKSLPQIKETKTPKEKETTEILNTFDYSNLTEIFYPDKINDFKRIENEMLNSDFFEKNKWSSKHPKYELAAFIHILNDKNYLKKLKGKNPSTSLLSYRKFFENRYGIAIKKEFQKNRVTEKLPLTKPVFMFIPI